ncbi:hypothetical protein TSTA_072410 [Talaromyces stipitatus ATCC 10500]|uniref:Uncharacterized protein n=1 Tax=Talaromyces stipitatus (strain ATCC 10500 / CBS 375.48 / QM 6759 / NRRL 1006) TaxID=441959 RepID=B8LU18_TALSN|nr:uncharacterized protein TSTA_072410 [Talaromyces stipitatus ATCC 10500]EED23848.1 hypothetical protein TSTA_072410 [Talaromyces stipitatus ATCC 10500]
MRISEATAHEAFTERKMYVTGDYPIIAQSPNGESVITGNADLVVCYKSGIWPLTSMSERTTDTYQGPAQAVTYMVGAHQKSVSLGPSDATETTAYGIVSGIELQFMKLNENVG